MMRLLTCLICWLVVTMSLVVDAQSSTQEARPAERRFELTYSGVINDVPKDAEVRIWIPVAQSDADQEIIKFSKEVLGQSKLTKEAVHNNQMLYVEVLKGHPADLPFKVDYEVVRREVQGLKSNSGKQITTKEQQLYTQPNRMVPIDGRPTELLTGTKLPRDPVKAGRSLYDRVEKYMTYDKTNPGYGQGNVLWACDSKTGNCTDFHSLFIALARNQQKPAFFEIGFPLPAERGEGKLGGYHCWARYYAEGTGWIPVDISEADKHPELKEYYFGNLTENRMAFSKGRDIVLEPKQSGEPLNYFIYPYVEVNGKPWPKAKIKLDFRYRDLDALSQSK